MNKMLAAFWEVVSRLNQYPPADSEPPEASGSRSIWTDHSSSSSPASSSSGYEYEVFLSFRGPDTRRGFGDCLYYGLRDAGVRVFLDSEDLRTGDHITSRLEKAIKESKISIPILSANYASSKWCLMELSIILGHWRSGNQMVLPIFYDVTPTEVRHQTGCYASAFRQHMRLYYRNIVPTWRDACADVAALSGWELKDVANGHEGRLIKIVVARVLSELKKAHLLVVDTVVGLEDDADAILRLLDVGAQDVKMIGISGMGGIGKTTLAKVIYNRIIDNFECHAFLEDIREAASQKTGLRHLQSMLLSSLTRQEPQDFASIGQGRNELSHRCRDRKVLILLDDVDDTSQVNALAGGVDWFGPGSRLIFTTRNIDILRLNQELLTYEVKPLSQDDALQLFCKHAFRNDFRKKKLSALCKEIVRTTGGLPLALEVIGSFLCDRKGKIWRDTFAKLKSIPNKEVQDKLKISYEALDHEQKQLFLDIACFFVGKDVRIVMNFWIDCAFFPEVNIEVLCQMSLIKIGEDNKLWMHDQLRDLGREIIRQENYKEPGLRSRLSNSGEAFTVLNKSEGTRNIEAISLLGMEGCTFSDLSFQHLSNVRFLQMVDAKLVGDFKDLLPILRWLSWRISPLDCTLSNLQLENLAILDLSHSKVSEEWNGWNSMKIGAKLKVLDLSYCHQLTRTPKFSNFPNLERLILEGCERLVEVDPSVLNLERLSFLNLKYCVSLREVPQGECFRRLTELLVDGTCIREILVSQSMDKLKHVSAKGCTRLTQIPICVSHFTSLSKLILDSSGIRKLPHSIGSLVKLQKLSLNNCNSLREIPETIGKLTSLVELSLSGAKIAALPNSFGDLVSLKVLKVDYSDIKSLPDVGKLTKLEVINASGCYHLEGEIPAEIGRLFNLKKLILDHTKIDGIPVSIRKLSHLEFLHLTGCGRLQALPVLPLGLTSVRVTCKSLVPIPNVDELIYLKQLGYVECAELVDLSQDISKLSRLEKLELSAANIRNLPYGIGYLPKLRVLDIDNCANLQRLPALPSSLTRLMVKYGSLQLPDLANLRNLSQLLLEKCFLLAEIPGLGDLVSLTCLVVTFCSRITKLDGIENLHCLTYLDVSGNANLQELPDLSKLKRLSVIKARGCENLATIEGLDSLDVLKHLDITNCISIQNLPDLSSLKLLSFFSANGCENVEELRGLDKLESLSSLHLSGCSKLKCLPDLSELKKLRQLDIAGCDNIAGTEVLSTVRSLEHVTVSRLDTLVKLQDMPNQAKLKFPPRGAASNFGNLVAACYSLQSNSKVVQLDSVNPRSYLSKMFSRERSSDIAHYKITDHLTVAKLEGDLTTIYRCSDKTSLKDRAVFLQKHRLLPSSSKEGEDVATSYSRPLNKYEESNSVQNLNGVIPKPDGECRLWESKEA